MLDFSAPASATDMAIIVRSFRRSRARRAVFEALVALEVASPAELAARAGVSAKHVRGVMLGEAGEFVPRLSLVALGLAVPRLLHGGRAFERSRKAVDVAARLAARAVT